MFMGGFLFGHEQLVELEKVHVIGFVGFLLLMEVGLFLWLLLAGGIYVHHVHETLQIVVLHIH